MVWVIIVCSSRNRYRYAPDKLLRGWLIIGKRRAITICAHGSSLGRANILATTNRREAAQSCRALSVSWRKVVSGRVGRLV